MVAMLLKVFHEIEMEEMEEMLPNSFYKMST
jgi:hypothetical protein